MHSNRDIRSAPAATRMMTTTTTQTQIKTPQNKCHTTTRKTSEGLSSGWRSPWRRSWRKCSPCPVSTWPSILTELTPLLLIHDLVDRCHFLEKIHPQECGIHTTSLHSLGPAMIQQRELQHIIDPQCLCQCLIPGAKVIICRPYHFFKFLIPQDP